VCEDEEMNIKLLPLSVLETLHEVIDFDFFRQGDDIVFVHGNDSVDVDLSSFVGLASRDTGIRTVRLCLETQTLKDLLLYGSICDSLVNTLAVLALDQIDETLSLFLELCFCDKLSEVDAARQGLQTVHVAGSGGAKVLLILTTLFATVVDTRGG